MYVSTSNFFVFDFLINYNNTQEHIQRIHGIKDQTRLIDIVHYQITKYQMAYYDLGGDGVQKWCHLCPPQWQPKPKLINQLDVKYPVKSMLESTLYSAMLMSDWELSASDALFEYLQSKFVRTNNDDWKDDQEQTLEKLSAYIFFQYWFKQQMTLNNFTSGFQHSRSQTVHNVKLF